MIGSKRHESAVLAVLALSLFVLTQKVLAQTAEEEGFASWYNRGYNGSRTASGELYDHEALTAAHPSLPFDSMVRVTRIDDQRTLVVRINDRMISGPEHIIDLSGAAARKLGILDSGVARVRIQALPVESILPVVDRPLARVRPEVQSPDERRTITEGVNAQPEANPAGKIVESARYTLQIGVFSSRKAASRFAGRFESSWIAEVPVEGGIHYRVYYSRFSREEPARVAQRALWVKGQESFLRVISP